MANIQISLKVYCGICGVDITDTVCQHAYPENAFIVQCANCMNRERMLQITLETLQRVNEVTEDV